jgi:hypothetical protein
MHPDTPKSSRSLLLEALSYAEHHVEFGSGRCDVEERGVVFGFWVFAWVSDDLFSSEEEDGYTVLWTQTEFQSVDCGNTTLSRRTRIK